MAAASIRIPIDVPALDVVQGLLQQLVTQQAQLIERTDHMATQDQIDAIAAQLAAFSTRFQAGISDVRQDIAGLKAANPALDLTGLETSVSGLAAAADDLDELDAENPPAPPAG